MPTFNCTFQARRKGKRISRQFSVVAPDQYTAIDIIVAEIGSDYGDMVYPTFKFGKTKALKSALVNQTLAHAGPEES